MASTALRRATSSDVIQADYFGTSSKGVLHAVIADRDEVTGRVKSWTVERLNSHGYPTDGVTHRHTLAEVRAYLAAGA